MHEVITLEDEALDGGHVSFAAPNNVIQEVVCSEEGRPPRHLVIIVTEVVDGASVGKNELAENDELDARQSDFMHVRARSVARQVGEESGLI